MYISRAHCRSRSYRYTGCKINKPIHLISNFLVWKKGPGMCINQLRVRVSEKFKGSVFEHCSFTMYLHVLLTQLPALTLLTIHNFWNPSKLHILARSGEIVLKTRTKSSESNWTGQPERNRTYRLHTGSISALL